MTREMIIKELNNRGYNAMAYDVTKNGVVLEGIVLKADAGVSPVIYTETINPKEDNADMSLDEAVTAVLDTYKRMCHTFFEFDVDLLSNRDYISNNIYVGLRRAGNEDIVKRPCDLDSIECYLYIRGIAGSAGTFTTNVTKAILESAGVLETEAWEQALSNTCAETSLKSMAQVMAEYMDMEYSEEMEEQMQPPFFVLSNESRAKGASAVLNKRVLEEFGKQHGVDKIIVLPSSIHEVLISPYDETLNLEVLSNMVMSVNSEQVDPVEQLADRAYIISLDNVSEEKTTKYC